jgi:hypothetical protein
MGDLKTKAEGLERDLILITRVIDEQNNKVEGLGREIKSIAEKAEKLEAENEQLKKQLEKK